MKGLKKKIIYTGYVFPEKMITGGTHIARGKKRRASIVISRGGGAVYPKLITLAIEAQRLLDEKTRTIITCGPATTRLKKWPCSNPVLNLKTKPAFFWQIIWMNLDDHLRTCRVSVSLCGYNTSVQLMRYGTPSVIVPYQNSSSQNVNQ